MTRSATTAVLVVACGLAVACSAPKDQPEPSVAPSAEEETTAAPAKDGDEPYPVGAIEEFLSAIGAVGTETPAQHQARMTAYEEALATCMQEQGFAYTPVDWSYLEDETVGPPPPQTDIDEADLEFAAEFGYGISTQGELSAGMAAEGFVDPNTEYLAGMSPAELDAYYLALLGPGQGDDYIQGLEPFDWSKHGCGGRASHETDDDPDAAPSFFTDDPSSFDETPYEALRAEIDALWATIEEDPRLVAAGQEWSDCMADAGHPGFTSVSSAPMSFFDEDMRIIDETFGTVPGDLSTAGYYTSQEYLAAEQAAAEMRSQLAERETATAVADLECQSELDYPRLYAEVSAELQQAFYDDHRTDLEAWLAAAEEFASRT